MEETRLGNVYIKRFRPHRIIEHWLNALCFAILVVTGLSQKFHDFELSHWIIINLGGIDMVRLIHRYTGLTFTILTLQHIIVASAGVIFKKWPASMIINTKDFQDAIDNLKFYFGLTNRPAICDRYDYKQKFEYWGVILGGLFMILSGLMLWFPTDVAKFLPSEFIPAAKALHTNEALLAFLVIVTWHIYNAIFSPEVFPLDTTIFTGKILRERMAHEHPLELARIEGVDIAEITGHRHEESHSSETAI
ncbi:MAG: cytochrome b/b6 domain-containing protein [Nitrospirota bacterium]